MKGSSRLATVVLVVLSISSVSTATDTQEGSITTSQCPNTDWQSATLIAHESDCTLYYVCLGVRKFLMKCGGRESDSNRLYFEPAVQGCVWPTDSSCTSLNSVIETETVPVITTECPANNEGNVVHLAHESNCSLFYTCDHGNKVKMECPAGLHFNAVLQVCDWPEFAGCTFSSDDSNSSVENEESSSENSTDSSDTINSVETDSDSWEGSDSDANETEAPIAAECPANNEGGVVHLAHESDCGLFYTCDHGQKVLMQCPDGLAFNPDSKACDWPEIVGCTPGGVDDSNSPDSGATDSSNSTEIDPSSSESSNEISDSSNSAENEWAGSESDGDASSTTEAVPINPEGSGAGATQIVPITSTRCSTDNEGQVILIPHESDCGSFYTCDQGRKVQMWCPDGLAFNPVVKECDWPEIVGCTPESADGSGSSDSGATDSSNSTEIEPSSSESSNEISDSSDSVENELASSEDSGAGATEIVPIISTRCSTDNEGQVILIPHESDCSSFYTCDQGRKVQMWCPDGLAFNPVVQKCDWPEIVGCTPESADDSGSSDSGATDSSNSTEIEPSSGESSNEISDSSNSTEIEWPSSESDSDTSNTEAVPISSEDSGSDTSGSSTEISGSNSSEEIETSSNESSTSSGDIINSAETDSDSSEDSNSDITDTEVPIATECPANNEGGAVHLAHESDCGLFYICNHGNKVQMECAVGLHFNAASQACDWPTSAGCTSGSSDDPSSSVEIEESSSEGSTNSTDKTDSAETNSDSSEGSDSDAEETEIPIAAECPANNEGGVVHLAHASDCGLFYTCNHGNKVQMECPTGLHFNAGSKICDWPESAGCTIGDSDGTRQL